MNASLQTALEALYGLERRRAKHDLVGITALLRALGDPQRRFRAVHVAGTNGKGSVCALIESVLRQAGVRTGLYTSPHLVDFRERIRVAGRWADESRLARRLSDIERLPEGRDRTFFEVCTALAFDDFAERAVDIAVVEVGLGGRLDCTNVLNPEVSVITSIGLDHTEILGETIESIAAEKAGIIKPGVPVVVGPLDEEALAVVARTAHQCQAPLELGVTLEAMRPPGGGASVRARGTPWGDLDLELPMPGDHQSANAGVALATLALLARAGEPLPAEAVRAGFRSARWPGRLEPCPSHPSLWWDGAHNLPGMAALAQAWKAAGLPMPRAVVLAVSRDKDADGIVRALAGLARGARLFATETRGGRALEAPRLARLASGAGFDALTARDVPSACRMALDGGPAASPVLLTGSLFAVGEAMEAFGGAPGEQL